MKIIFLATHFHLDQLCILSIGHCLYTNSFVEIEKKRKKKFYLWRRKFFLFPCRFVYFVHKTKMYFIKKKNWRKKVFVIQMQLEKYWRYWPLKCDNAQVCQRKSVLLTLIVQQTDETECDCAPFVPFSSNSQFFPFSAFQFIEVNKGTFSNNDFLWPEMSLEF